MNVIYEKKPTSYAAFQHITGAIKRNKAEKYS